MPKLSRRHVTIGAGALAVTSFSIGRARAAEFTYKYANNLPLTHPMNKRAQEAAAKIKDETGARFELQIFPSSQLGSDTDTLGQICSGAVDFFTLSGLILSTLVPAAALNGVGFAFKDYDTVWKAMDGKVGEYIRAEIAKSRSIFAFEKNLGQRLPANDDFEQAHRHACRLCQSKDPRAGSSAVDLNVQSVRGGSHDHQFQ